MGGVDVYCIRHAQSVFNTQQHLYVGGRSSFTPLSPLGERQVAALGKRLLRDGLRPDFVHTSSAVRAIATAQESCRTIGFPLENIVIDDALHELGQGDWEGKLRTECYTPESLARISADPKGFKAPNGESQAEVTERMLNYLAQCAEQGGTHFVYTHGIAAKCVLQGILQFEQSWVHRMPMENTALTHLRYANGCWTPISINDYSHLTPDLR